MSYFLNGYDNTKIYIHIWDNVSNPIGVVQIIHGMAEHAARYDDFAKYLNSKGFVVFADDHRGHGKTAGSVDNLGYIGKDGFNAIVIDERFVTNIIKTRYPNLPIFIFAHSFGSFIGQEYINRYSSEINGIILSGSAKQSGIRIYIAGLISALYKIVGDERKKNPFLEKLIFWGYNRKFYYCKSQFTWLSSNPLEVEKYENDKYCGTVFTTNFYYYLFKGFQSLYKKNKRVMIEKKLPLFIIAGEDDPVGNYGDSVTKLYDYYNRLSLNNLTLKIYTNRRHELLNEMNKEIIYDDILEWIQKNI